MRHHDLIAYLQHVPNQFDALEFRDVTGHFRNIQASPHRMAIRFTLPAGLYRCLMQTKPGAFDLKTAMVDMVRVPDGQRVSVGPWDLDHIHNRMAMPMVRASVNGHLKGGIWFDLPGPGQIRQGVISADFGFEVQPGQTELLLEFIEADRPRLGWPGIAFLEFRQDDRPLLPLSPIQPSHPRIYTDTTHLQELRNRWSHDPDFHRLVQELKNSGDLQRPGEGSHVDLACLVHHLTGEKCLADKVIQKIMSLVSLPTWSGRPDPLIMGGDNDRIIGIHLYDVAMAWDFLNPLFSASQRRIVLAKVGEYLQKLHDFTILQRAYMGCPALSAHSLGTWNGVAIACMAFHDDLPIARKALPFFHGLFRDSLSLFPPGGKTNWATFLPFHLLRYLAAAHTFGGPQPELSRSDFLDHLGPALLACFNTPNSQELQRGLRTIEHRHITAYLSRFHPTPGIDAIYQAFAQQERQAAGDLSLGLFDLLYAPMSQQAPASFDTRPLHASDIGSVIASSNTRPRIGLSFNAGLPAGARASFSLAPHNREYPQMLACLELSIDGAPLLINLNIASYGLDSALTNTLCFNDGGALTNGQYLQGDVGPQYSAYIRRCHLGERFIYIHAVITPALDPTLDITQAERILVFDLQTGAIVIQDSFSAQAPLRFATHLHCTGSITPLSPTEHRLTGGQANLIAGIKGGSKGLSDAEKGEVFVTTLQPPGLSVSNRVIVEEARWIPSYIYGLNFTGNEPLTAGRYPHYQRWRLEAENPVMHHRFTYAICPKPGQVRWDGHHITLPESARLFPGGATSITIGDVTCQAEHVLLDQDRQQLTCLGVRQFKHGSADVLFNTPVDMEYDLAGNDRSTIHSPSDCPVHASSGVAMGPFSSASPNKSRNHHPWHAWFVPCT